MEYICIKSFLKVKEGDIFKKDSDKEGYYTNGSVSLPEDYFKIEEFFKEHKIFKTKEITISDKQKHLYRIEIEVNCTKNKLKDIENFLKENLNDIINE